MTTDKERKGDLIAHIFIFSFENSQEDRLVDRFETFECSQGDGRRVRNEMGHEKNGKVNREYIGHEYGSEMEGLTMIVNGNEIDILID